MRIVMCPQCGALAPSNTRFCRFDGHALSDATAPLDAGERPEQLVTSPMLEETRILPGAPTDPTGHPRTAATTRPERLPRRSALPTGARVATAAIFTLAMACVWFVSYGSGITPAEAVGRDASAAAAEAPAPLTTGPSRSEPESSAPLPPISVDTASLAPTPAPAANSASTPSAEAQPKATGTPAKSAPQPKSAPKPAQARKPSAPTPTRQTPSSKPARAENEDEDREPVVKPVRTKGSNCSDTADGRTKKARDKRDRNGEKGIQRAVVYF